MAKVPTIRTIFRENIPESPAWVIKILQPLNLLIESIVNAFSNQLTFSENIAAQIRFIEFTTLSTYTSADDFTTISFTNTLGGRALGVLIMNAAVDDDDFIPITKAVSLSWREVEGIIRIEHIAGLEDDTSYKFIVIVVI